MNDTQHKQIRSFKQNNKRYGQDTDFDSEMTLNLVMEMAVVKEMGMVKEMEMVKGMGMVKGMMIVEEMGMGACEG